MINKNRDSKFVIYQVLYIFVITVLALKGADLDLRRVALEEDTVQKEVRDSLMAVLDSLYALGIDFSIKIDPNVVVENEQMREQLAALNKKLETLKDFVPPPKEDEIKKEEIVEEQTLLQSPISAKQTYIQHTWNIARNTGTVPANIYDPRNMNNPIAVVPAGQEKKFDLTDQTEVIIKFGSQEERIKVLPNKAPEIKIERVTTKMNSADIYVKDLQRITAFKVTIIDQRPDQLKVTYAGPISVSGPTKDSNGNLIYNVSLKIASTENAFDSWLDKNGNLRESDGRYKVNFFFTAVDERSKDRVQVGDSFFFTEFSN
jgi:ribosomal protein L25 (general stress protein Ctc)